MNELKDSYTAGCSVTKKKPMSTYSRKSPLSITNESDRLSSSTGHHQLDINDNNFAQKMLEALKPTPNCPNLRNKDGSDDENIEEDGKRHCVKNVHELLESGCSNRLYDELDYLVSDLESLMIDNKKSTLILRHAVLSDLVYKLCGDHSTMQNSIIRSSGLIQRIGSYLDRLETDDPISYHFLLMTLFSTCADVRRIDYFVPKRLCHKICLYCLAAGEEFDQLVYGKGRNKLQSECFSQRKPLLDMVVWLLVKLIISDETNFNHSHESSKAFFMTEAILLMDHCSKLLLSTKSLVLQSRILYIFGYMISLGEAMEVMTETLLHFSCGIGHPTGSNEIIVGALRLLVSISGPDSGAALVANEIKFRTLLKEVFVKFVMHSGDEEVRVLVLTMIANTIDRNQYCRSYFAEDDNFMAYLVSELLHETDRVSRHYLGMILGILLFDLVQRRTSLFSQSPRLKVLIGESFENLISYLKQSKILTEELQRQLLVFADPYL